MDALAPFRIPIASLKADEASYEWEVGSDFLQHFDDEHEAEKGKFRVILELENSAGIFNLDFTILGYIDTPCDRCLTPIQLPVEGNYQLIVKTGDPAETTDEVVFIDPESPGLNVGVHIYDFILLSIPISRRIPGCDTSVNPPCDMTVLAHLSDQINKDNSTEDDDDSLWGDLKKVIDN